jgi:hypothetical protein
MTDDEQWGEGIRGDEPNVRGSMQQTSRGVAVTPITRGEAAHNRPFCDGHHSVKAKDRDIGVLVEMG